MGIARQFGYGDKAYPSAPVTSRNQETVTSNPKPAKPVVTPVTREEFDYLQERVAALEAFLVVEPPQRDRAAYMREYRKRQKGSEA